MAFPSVDNPSGITEITHKAQLKSSFENGAVQSRTRATSAKKRWQLIWELITSSDYQSLQTHLETEMGNTFAWTHPVNGGDPYTVRYSDDELSADFVSPGWWRLILNLEEA